VDYMCLFTTNKGEACGGAWMGFWFQHRRGWLSLGEALQIQWFPAKTKVAEDGSRLRTVTNGGENVKEERLTRWTATNRTR